MFWLLFGSTTPPRLSQTQSLSPLQESPTRVFMFRAVRSSGSFAIKRLDPTTFVFKKHQSLWSFPVLPNTTRELFNVTQCDQVPEGHKAFSLSELLRARISESKVHVISLRALEEFLRREGNNDVAELFKNKLDKLDREYVEAMGWPL